MEKLDVGVRARSGLSVGKVISGPMDWVSTGQTSNEATVSSKKKDALKQRQKANVRDRNASCSDKIGLTERRNSTTQGKRKKSLFVIISREDG